MTFTFGIPAANNNPSADQPRMLNNFTAISNLINVDHIGFNTTLQGQHKQVTFNSNNVPALAPTDPTSILYTNVGSASSVAELFYQNANAIYLLSCIKAFGNFVTSVSTTTFTNSYNFASISGGSGTYTLTLNTNVVSTNNIVVLINSGSPLSSISWSFVNPVLTITTNPPLAFNINISLAILQY